jgi:hypothetical protein
LPAPPLIASPTLHVSPAATVEAVKISSAEPPTNDAPVSAPVVSDQVYTINIYMILLIFMARGMAFLGIYYTIST